MYQQSYTTEKEFFSKDFGIRNLFQYAYTKEHEGSINDKPSIILKLDRTLSWNGWCDLAL